MTDPTPAEALTMYDLDPNQDAAMNAEIERMKADTLKRYPHLAIPLEPCPFCAAVMVEEADEEGGYFTHPGRKGAERADCWLADAIVKRHSDPDLDDVAAWNTRPPPPDAGEVRTYREGVEASARVADDFPNPYDEHRECGEHHAHDMACELLAAAIRKLP